MPMAKRYTNRFWDCTAEIRVISNQITNQFGPKEEFQLLGEKMTEICPDITLSLKGIL
jgi:hypothetical protein